MKKFRVSWIETTTHEVVIEAEDKDKAIEKSYWVDSQDCNPQFFDRRDDEAEEVN